jgi:hypothetical protein
MLSVCGFESHPDLARLGSNHILVDHSLLKLCVKLDEIAVWAGG